jgi:hypothetical protein
LIVGCIDQHARIRDAVLDLLAASLADLASHL